jgi:hypothetical protein
MTLMKRILSEPLLHFLLLGAGLFIAYSMMQKNESSSEMGAIVITQGQFEHLAAGFAKTWQRPPTPAEMTGLVRDRIREEVYYREAMAMGLDKDDTIIRRRLRQKMEFISEDIAAQVEPTRVELNAYLQAHPEKFLTEPRFSFSQVYLHPEKHGDNLASDAAQILVQLNRTESKADPAALSDAFMLGQQFTTVRSSEVANLFGKLFAVKLNELTPGQWQGPVESGYGMHLVRVSERTEGGLPSLEEVRDLVQQEWAHTRRLEANEQFYQDLLKRYTVTIEGLEPPAEQNKLALNKAK